MSLPGPHTRRIPIDLYNSAAPVDEIRSPAKTSSGPPEKGEDKLRLLLCIAGSLADWML